MRGRHLAKSNGYRYVDNKDGLVQRTSSYNRRFGERIKDVGRPKQENIIHKEIKETEVHQHTNTLERLHRRALH